ncbi:MAG: chemotaxis protein CheW [Treponemataceae bacterium]
MHNGDRAILRDRAKKLAFVPEPTNEETVQVLRFLLGTETYAVEYAHIVEVAPLLHVTPLPCVPSFVRGIINLRGRIVSILDLKSLFGLPDIDSTSTTSAIILQSPLIEFGLLVDEILGMSTIPLSGLQVSLPTLTDIRSEYLKGVTAEGLVLLDAEKFLADKKLLVNETVRSTV